MLNSTRPVDATSFPEGLINDTTGVYLRVSLTGLLIYVGAYLPIILFSVVGNGLLLLSFLRIKGARRGSDYYIFCLAAVDLLTGLIAMPLTICNRLIISDVTCQARTRYLIFLPVYICGAVSLSILMGVTFDRYIAISYPFRYPTMMTSKTTKRIILFLFIFGIVFGSLPQWSFGSDPYQWVCELDAYEAPIATIHILLVSSVVPLILLCMMAAYGRIFYLAFFKKTTISHSQNRSQSALRQKKILRTTLTSLIVLVTFTVCWFPNSFKIVFELYFADDIKSLLPVQTFSELCVFLSSCTNPVIYGLRNKKFKQAYKEILFNRLYPSTLRQGIAKSNNSVATMSDKTAGTQSRL